MKSYLGFLLLFLWLFGFSFWYLAVSPLKYEFTIDWWNSQSQIVKVTNDWDAAMTIYISKEDFIAWDDSGTPKFIKPQDKVTDQYSLSSWISTNEDHFTLAKWETKEVKFNITVPQWSEPGWHYGAIFFTPSIEGKGQVAVVQRLWVLILVNVPWDIKVDWNLSSFKLWWIEWNSFKESDKFDNLPVVFQTNFKNLWNVHIKPQWKIVILDDKGEQLKKIWKKSIQSTAWAYIWEEMVDYIPVNDALWNVLPNSERKFDSAWEWFGYQVLKEDWTKEVKFKSLQDYMTEKWVEENRTLKFYETIKEVKVKKKFVAQLQSFYEGKDWQKKEFNQQKEFYLTYKESRVWINSYIIWGWILVLLFVVYYVFIGKKRAEAKLRERIMKEMNK